MRELKENAEQHQSIRAPKGVQKTANRVPRRDEKIVGSRRESKSSNGVPDRVFELQIYSFHLKQERNYFKKLTAACANQHLKVLA